MAKTSIKIEVPKSGLLKIKVIPKSKTTEISDVMIISETEKIYKIKIKSAPEKNKANIELIKFLSSILNIKTHDIEIISGNKGKIKLIKITNGSLQ